MNTIQRAFDLGSRDAFRKYAGVASALFNVAKSPFMKQVGQGLMAKAPELALTAGVPLAMKAMQPKPVNVAPQTQPALSPGA